MKIAAFMTLGLLLSGCSKDTSMTTIHSGTAQDRQDLKTQITTKEGEALFEFQESEDKLAVILPEGKMPDPANSDYISIIELEPKDGEGKVVDIKAVKIILDSNSRLHIYEHSKLSAMKIEAKEIVISSDFNLPGAQLFIKAEKLTVTGNGRISTSAVNYAVIPEKTKDGLKGLPAGDITLDVKELELSPGRVRFAMNGGEGQAAGFGIPGAAGKNVENNGQPLRVCTTIISGCHEREVGFRETSRTVVCTGDNFPTDGSDAVAAGSPGAGGNGGQLILSENLKISAEFIEQKAGAVGAVAPLTKGGIAGTPRNVQTQFNERTDGARMCSGGGGGGKHTSPRVNLVAIPNQPVSGTTTDGRDAVSPATAKESSSEGKISYASGKPFSEKYLNLRLSFAKDVYRNLKLEEAVKEFSEINQLSEAIEESEKIGQVEKESHLLLAQIRTHKDIDGYPLNFAPNLSMARIVSLYKSEVERAFETLKFTSYFSNKIKSVQDKSEKIQDRIEVLNQNIILDKAQNSNAHENWLVVEKSLSEVNESQKAFEQAMNNVVAQIESEARRNIHNQEKKKKLLGAVKLVASLAKASPVGQPAAAAIGSSIETVITLSQNENTDWKDVVAASYSTYQDLKEVNWEKSKDDWNEKYSSLYYDKFKERNPGITKKKFEAYMKNLIQTTKPLYKVTSDYLEENYKNQVPKSAYDNEVERIKSIHPAFKELTAKLNDLQIKKDKLNNNLLLTMSVIRETESNIIKSIQAISSTESDYVNFTNGLDFTVDDALKFYEKSARETLLKYKTYLVKSYSYRLLKPWKGSMDLEKMEKQLARFSTSNGDMIDLDMLKGAYNEDLKMVSKEMFDALSNGTLKEYVSAETFDLNSGELSALKAGKSIVLDLNRKIDNRNSEENRRIISVEVESADLVDTTDTAVDFIFKHSGRSILTKNNRNYVFIHESNNISWVTRVTNHSVSPLNETNIQNSLFALFLSDVKSDDNLQEYVGLNSNVVLNLSKVETLAELRNVRVKVTYSFNLR